MEVDATVIVLKQWGAAVNAARKEAGLTQTQLGHRAGDIDQSTISRIEHGDYRQMTPALLLRLSVALQQGPHVLFEWPTGLLELARFQDRERVA